MTLPTSHLTPTPTTPTSLIHIPENYFEILRLETLFPVPQPLEVEIGSGDGSFLAAYAAARTGVNFVGVERLLGRLRKLDKKAFRAGLTNVCCVRIEASYFLEFMIPKAGVCAVHIYFPDPWPKRRHHKNRLINERFPEIVAQALGPSGIVYLRTDDAAYFDQMIECFGKSPLFQSEDTPGDLRKFLTDFERGFTDRGVPTRHAAYRKIS